MHRTVLAGAVLPAILSAVSLGADFGLPAGAAETESIGIREVMHNLAVSFSHTGPVLWAILLVCMFAATVWKNLRKKEKPLRALALCSGFLALFMVLGQGFSEDNSLFLLSADIGQMIKTVLFFAGYSNLTECAGYGLEYVLAINPRAGQPGSGMLSRILFRTGKHSVPVKAGLLMLLWLPYLIIAYPAYICPDSWYILSQYFKLSTFTAHHPPVYTILVGAAADWSGRLLGGNAGLFCVILLQYILMAFVLAYVIHIITGMRPPAWIFWSVILAAAVSPYYTNYAVVILKDVPYGCFFLLWLTEMIMLLRGRHTAGHMCLFWFSAVLMICLRKNGIYVVMPSLLLMVLYYVRRAGKVSLPERITGRGQDVRSKRLHICAYGIIFMFAVAVPAHLTEAACCSIWNIQKGSVREALSLPFQQTARYVCEYGDEIPEEEKQVIDRVLVYDKLAELYNPRLADPVKGTFRSSCTRADLTGYARVWAAQGLRHPLVYFKATMNQNYQMFCPWTADNNVFTKTFEAARGNEHASGVCEKTGAHDTWTAPLKSCMESWYKLCFSLPGAGLLSNPAVYDIVLFLASVICLNRRYGRWMIAAVPLCLSLLIAAAGPAMQGNARYLLPVIYTVPVLLAWLAELCRNDGKEKTDGDHWLGE